MALSLSFDQFRLGHMARPRAMSDRPGKVGFDRVFVSLNAFCLPEASSLLATFGFTPSDPANYIEGERAMLCKGQQERPHRLVELCRLLGSHRVKRKRATCMLGSNVVLDRLRDGYWSGLALTQLLEQPLLLQCSNPIERLVGGVVGETVTDLANALAPGSGPG